MSTPDARRALLTLSADQNGLATRQQLLEIGFSRRQISARAAAGTWARVAPLVYRVDPVTVHRNQPLHAAVLSAKGWASRRSAAFLQGYEWDPQRPLAMLAVPPAPELVVPYPVTVSGASLGTSLGATVHRSRWLPDEHLTEVHGIPSTTVPRTLLDLGTVLDVRAHRFAVGSALLRGRTTVSELELLLAPGLPGRSGARRLREAIGYCGEPSACVERRLRDVVARAVLAGHLPAPSREPVLALDGTTLPGGLVWPRQMIVALAEESPEHTDAEARAATSRAESIESLTLLGWMVLRFTWRVASLGDYLVVGQIRAALAGRSIS